MSITWKTAAVRPLVGVVRDAPLGAVLGDWLSYCLAAMTTNLASWSSPKRRNLAPKVRHIRHLPRFAAFSRSAGKWHLCDADSAVPVTNIATALGWTTSILASCLVAVRWVL